MSSRKAILLCLYFGLTGQLVQADEAAERIFADQGRAVVQIRVVDLASDDKSAIGSGFQVDADGLMVTNFHVVSDYAHKPERYRLEYVQGEAKPVPVKLVDVDVVHDLALLQAAHALPVSLRIASAKLAQGERMYSMGNPLDLAMSIIEGTYNGYVSGARFRKVLFSASLNPGMSGGPAVNAVGEVVGINVAHGGEQISFLVPVRYLVQLIARRDDTAWQTMPMQQRIATSLRREQENYVSAFLGRDWEMQDFGEFRVPGRLSDTLKCWGGSTDNPDFRYQQVYQQCDSQDAIYIDDLFETGGLAYAFHRFSSELLNSVQFYSLLAQRFVHKGDNNAYDKEQVGNFRCRENFVRGSGLDWRMSFCARQYRRYSDLYDVSVAMSSTEMRRRGMVVQLRVDGVTEPLALSFVRRFVEHIEWKP